MGFSSVSFGYCCDIFSKCFSVRQVKYWQLNPSTPAFLHTPEIWKYSWSKEIVTSVYWTACDMGEVLPPTKATTQQAKNKANDKSNANSYK